MTSELMLVVVVALICVLGMEPPAPWMDVANLVAAPLLAALLWRLSGRPRDAWTLLVLTSLGPILNFVIPWGKVSLVADVVKVVLWTLSPAYLALRLFAVIRAKPEVHRAEIAGAVTIYLLVGLFFANVFEALFLVDPHALRFGASFGDQRVGFGEVLYFSYVTLATVGYGDVSPAHPAARLVAILEAITGLMFISILIARFVALLTSRRAESQSPTGR